VSANSESENFAKAKYITHYRTKLTSIIGVIEYRISKIKTLYVYSQRIKARKVITSRV